MSDYVEKQREFFDEHKADLTDPRYRKFRSILESLPKGKVLEIGCSGGEFLEDLSKAGWSVEGMEISEKAAERGRSKGLSIQVGDANRPLRFSEGQFDVIVAGEVIEHTFDDSAFLRECSRILKPGGHLLLSTPNLASLKNRFLLLFGRNPRFALAEYHYRVYTIRILRDLVDRSPFHPVFYRGNYVLYSRRREPILGGLFERMADRLPSLAEHFIVLLRKP